jgi:predicted HTH domain antitoxin
MASNRFDDVETAVDRDELASIIGKYALGDLSLGNAAQRVGVSRLRMQEILLEVGVQPRIGPESEEDARNEVENALEY